MGGLLTTSYIDNRAAIEIVDEPKHCSADSEEVKDLPPCVERRRKQLRKFGEHLLDRFMIFGFNRKAPESNNTLGSLAFDFALINPY